MKESKTAIVIFECDNGYNQCNKEITIKYSDVKDLTTKIRMYKKSGILINTNVTEPNTFEYMGEGDITRIIVKL